MFRGTENSLPVVQYMNNHLQNNHLHARYKHRMQVDTEADTARTTPTRSGRGGDRGGRRPLIGDAVLPPQRVFSEHLRWMRKTTGDGGRGRGLVAEFIRTLMAAATGLGLSLPEWHTIARSPARFRTALRRELDQSE